MGIIKNNVSSWTHHHFCVVLTMLAVQSRKGHKDINYGQYLFCGLNCASLYACLNLIEPHKCREKQMRNTDLNVTQVRTKGGRGGGRGRREGRMRQKEREREKMRQQTRNKKKNNFSPRFSSA